MKARHSLFIPLLALLCIFQIAIAEEPPTPEEMEENKEAYFEFKTEKTTVHLTRASKEANYQLIWDMGDGHTYESTSNKFSHTYKKEGDYSVRLTATDKHNKQIIATWVHIITIME